MVYISDIHQFAENTMADTGIAKIFMHGRSQAVRLPLAFRLPGDRVRVRRVEGGILLEPIVTDLDTWFAELDRFADVPFMEEGRRQPPMPEPKDPFA
jgi:antitoxin VapB